MPDAMLEIARIQGIPVEIFDFAPPTQGIYFCNEDMPPIIGLDRSLRNNVPLLRCILAEELGHHFTSAGYCVTQKFFSYNERMNISRAEYKALKWAANYLMPENDLLDALKSGLCEVWELAEHFDVTEEFVKFRLRLFGARNIA